MTTLFNLDPERYWQFPVRYTAEQQKNEIIARIASNEYIGSDARYHGNNYLSTTSP